MRTIENLSTWLACNICIAGGKPIDANFSAPQYLRLDWSQFLGSILFEALILSDHYFISHDWPEFQIKKIHQHCERNSSSKTKATS